MGKKKDLSFKLMPDQTIDTAFLHQNRSVSTITWIGHSTFLIQMQGLNILTDPVWSGRMGFEKRLSKPALAIEELPPIDVVLISHSHYDHLDLKMLRKLNRNILMIVPSGLKKTLEKKRFSSTYGFHIFELGWWESMRYNGIEFTFVPAQHWTRRTLLDTNKSWWGGFMITPGNEKSIYFAGDSAYFDGFGDIGKRFSISHALLPIGAYEPEWFMSCFHMCPEEAVKVFGELGADVLIPMHYGAFRIADDTPKEALDRLQKAWEVREEKTGRLDILKLGEISKINKKSKIN
jgi:L-ascorbate metabolism protein UlaG (beta-lactamase superfamily)